MNLAAFFRFFGVCVTLLVATLALGDSALAQPKGSLEYANIVTGAETSDVNGVSRTTGQIQFSQELFSIGQDRKLTLSFHDSFPIYSANGLPIKVNLYASTAVYNNNTGSFAITLPTGTYIANSSFGHTVTGIESCAGGTSPPTPPGTLIRHGFLTTRDGIVAELRTPAQYGCSPDAWKQTKLVKMTFPNGEIWTFESDTVRSNRGYGFRGTIPFNEAYIACSWTTGSSCPALSGSPQISVVNQFPDNIITAADGTVTRVPSVSPMATGQPLQSIRFDSNPDRNVTFNTNVVPFTISGAAYGHVTSVSRSGRTWTYQFQAPASYQQPGGSTNPNDYKSYLTITDPDGKSSSSQSWTYPEPFLISTTSELGHTSTYSYQGVIPNGVILPEGNKTIATFDARGNATDIAITPKPGTGAVLHVTAGFPTTCTAYRTCNQPLWTKDAMGNQTDYTYDNAHGGITSVTGPAVSGIRPQVRYAYVQRYAWVLNAAGAYVQASSPIWLLDYESSCKASAATGNPAAPCAGGDEVRTTFDYGPNSGPNNLFLRGKVTTADGISLRTCYLNDKWGRKIAETAPRAGLTSCP